MHAEVFGLTRKPFLISPNPDVCHFRNPNIEKARNDILGGFRGHTGLAVLTGPIGSGKTALLLQLRNDLSDSPLISVSIGPKETTGTVFQAIYEELGLEPRDAGGIPAEEALLARLEKEGCDDGSVRIIVDDAHNLAPDALTALVRLASPDPVRALHVQLLLAGLPEVVGSLEQLNLQRFQHVVTIWARLENLRFEDVAPYVNAQIEAAGGEADVLFPPDALERIAEYTEGNPALINMLCDLCLETAHLSTSQTIDMRVVDAVAGSRGLSRRRALKGFSGFSGLGDWAFGLRGKFNKFLLKLKSLCGEKAVGRKIRGSNSLISRRAGERAAWGVGIIGLAVLVGVIAMPGGPAVQMDERPVPFPTPTDSVPVTVISLDEQPSAELPSRPEPVAASQKLAELGTKSSAAPVSSDQSRDAAAIDDKAVRESLRLREEIKTLQAELDLMKTREQRTMRELQLVRSERDRLLGESRRTQPDAGLRKTSATRRPQSTSASNGTMHTVAKGDTLWSIARRYGVTVDKLVKWNGLSSGSALKPGQTIVVRSAGQPSPVTTVQTSPAASSPHHYQVQRGDTLYGISRRFNVSVSDLSTWNNLQPASSLRVGQTLVVASSGGETS